MNDQSGHAYVVAFAICEIFGNFYTPKKEFLVSNLIFIFGFSWKSEVF